MVVVVTPEWGTNEMRGGEFTVPQVRPILIEVTVDAPSIVARAASELIASSGRKDLTLADLARYLEKTEETDLLGNSIRGRGWSDQNTLFLTLSFSSARGHKFNAQLEFGNYLIEHENTHLAQPQH
jgi:hypothetical protein